MAAKEADRQRLRRGDAGSGEPWKHLAESGPRAHRIREDPTGDTALDGARERIDDARGHGIVGEDVEEEMHVPLRRIDVGDETIDDFVVGGEHLDRVAAENRHVAERFGEAHGRREFRAGFGVVDRRAPREPR